MEERKKNKMQWIILLVLVTLIILLVVGIILIKIRKRDYSSIQKAEILDSIGEEIFSMEEDDAVNYLDAKIAEYAGTDLEFDMKMSKVYMFYNAKQYDRALEVTEDISEDELDAHDKLDYYSALGFIYKGLSDEEKSKYYDGLYISLYNDLYSNNIEGGGDV